MAKVEIGAVTNSEIGKNKDDDEETMLLQASITDADDVQTVELVEGSGSKSRPTDDAAVIIVSVDESYKLGIAVDDGIKPELEKGEREHYSIDPDDNTKMAFLKYLNDGNINANGENDNAVRFAELETAFNLLRTEMNALITIINSNGGVFNAHVHLRNPPAPALTGPSTTFVAPGVPAVADMSDAKINNIRVADLSEDT